MPKVRAVATLLLTLSATLGGAAPAVSAPAGSAANPVKARAAARLGFDPARLVVRPRAIVWFTSIDHLVHTATAVKQAAGKPLFDSGTPSAATFSFRAPRLPGTYNYLCLVHPYQRGVLVVRRPVRR